jgi:SAM-dependent methyltransferase
MTDVWSERADAYRTSEAHREGVDLDLLVAWAAGARTALDVATGGGHVARRLRDAGVEVLTCDPAPGMRPDVICRAEDLPFADRSFDVVASRLAAHHFEGIEAGLREMARVARDRVLIADNLYLGAAGEEADRVRDPSHVRNYSEEEWRALLEGARLRVEDVRLVERWISFAAWLERARCTGEDAERVRELLTDRIEGGALRLQRIVFKTVPA